MLEETIDILTRQMLENVFNDKKNKQKTICAYGDNEDDDFEIELWEEDIDKLLDILKEVSE